MPHAAWLNGRMRPFRHRTCAVPLLGACAEENDDAISPYPSDPLLCAAEPMTLPAPTYDLVLLLDLQAEEAARAKIVADARAAIEAQGELLRHDEWGERALTYPIDRKANAEYHLLQFHAGDSALLDGLGRTLRIADEVMRFRIVKLKPGVPDAPEMVASPAVRQAETPVAEAPVESAPAAQPESEADAPATAAPVAEPAEAEAAAGDAAAAETSAADVPVAEPAA